LRVLVTGATGYIGGRLVPRLLAKGHSVRCLARDPQRLQGRPWPGVEIVSGDMGEPESLPFALEDIDVAYYLVHSMAGGRSFRERDAKMARTFGEAARCAGVKRIVYLGGLGDPGELHSKHLISRQEVGSNLAQAGVPVVEFRAAVIVGSGSASFEMIRHLTDRLPMMFAPRWVQTRCQPIGIRSVLDYLVEALEHPEARGIYEIGGSDILTYRKMMLGYAKAKGLRRIILPIYMPQPTFSSHVIDLLTPIPHRIAAPLLESLRTEVVVRDDRALRTFSVRPTSYAEALDRALGRIAADDVETTWASSLASTAGKDSAGRQLDNQEGLLVERHWRKVRASPERVLEIVCALGGEEGWPTGNALWQFRGAIDRLAGGVGMRRGRRHPRELRVGDPLDFWRVESFVPGRMLRLRAEMKLPGRAWLQFEVRPEGRKTHLEQTAFFEPHGLLGNLYWYAALPLHRFIFPGLVQAIQAQAEKDHTLDYTLPGLPAPTILVDTRE
jgi:uncharacterized protein YbjT (DUF2867 family)